MAWLKQIVRPGEYTQLFVKGYDDGEDNSHTNLVGVYDSDSLEMLVRDGIGHTERATAVYYTLNAITAFGNIAQPNALVPARHGTARNRDVTRRRLLLIDLDPARPADVCATEQEKHFAHEKAYVLKDHLTAAGWPEPAMMDSGNGCYLLYRVDLPADDRGLLKRVLHALSEQFTDQNVSVDKKVYDAVRVVRLPGTLNRKGESTPERPHRPCRILSVPANGLIAVSTKLLEGIAQKPEVREAERVELRAPVDAASLARARRYIGKMPSAVSGQGGHDATFAVACALVVDFGLSQEQAWPLMAEFNHRCEPPWSDEDLRHKLEGAAERLATTVPGRRRLACRVADPADPCASWPPLPGAEFIGYVPDFGVGTLQATSGDGDTKHNFWLYCANLLAGCTLRTAQPVLPDVLLRQLHWGAEFPKNWRTQLEKWTGQVTLEKAGVGNSCKRGACLYAGLGIRHQHFANAITHWGAFEAYSHLADEEANRAPEIIVPSSPPDPACYFGSEMDQYAAAIAYQAAQAEWLARVAPEPEQPIRRDSPRVFELKPQQADRVKNDYRTGGLRPIYWPGFLFGQCPKIGWSISQVIALQGIVRECTKAGGSRQGEFRGAVIHGNRVVSAGLAGRKVVCPILRRDQDYVVFGGNGRRSGRGYQLFGRTWRGWLNRAFYEDPGVLKVQYEILTEFLRGLACLNSDLDLTPVGYFPSQRKPEQRWKSLDDMLRCLKTGAGREWLDGCTLRIYAPADWQVRWRYFFSRRLGFRWIPASVDDLGPRADSDDVPSPIGQQIAAFMDEHGFTQKDLAVALSFVLHRNVSRQCVSRHIHGQCEEARFVQAFETLRAAARKR